MSEFSFESNSFVKRQRDCYEDQVDDKQSKYMTASTATTPSLTTPVQSPCASPVPSNYSQYTHPLSSPFLQIQYDQEVSLLSLIELEEQITQTSDKTIDFKGQIFTGASDFTIDRPNLTLKNLRINIIGNVNIYAENLTFENVHFVLTGSVFLCPGINLEMTYCTIKPFDLNSINYDQFDGQDNKDALIQGQDIILNIRKCDFKSLSNQSCLKFKGMKSRVEIDGCKFEGDCVHGIYVADGAQVLIQRTDLTLGAGGKQGVRVVGADSRVIMERCSVVGGAKNSVEVETGGFIEMVQCKLKDCTGGSSVRIHGKGSKASMYQTCITNTRKHGIIVLNGAALFANRCDVLGSQEGRGILGDGIGTRLEIEQCDIGKCKLLCIRATQQAEVIVKRSDIHDSLELHGVAADNQGRMTLTDCRIYDNKQNGVVALSGGFLEINRSEIWGSKELHGVVAADEGSLININRSTIHHNLDFGVLADAGSSIHITLSEVYESLNSHGVGAQGEGSSAIINDCKIYNNQQAAVVVSAGAVLAVESSEIWGSKKFYGICALGQDSVATVGNCKVFDICMHAVYSMEGAIVKLHGTEIYKATAGFCVEGGQSRIEANQCNLHDFFEHAAFAKNGGFLALNQSQIQRGKEGIRVQGLNTLATIEESVISEFKENGICVLEQGSAVLQSTDVVGCGVWVRHC
eukprot:TRINITY_DN33535_c0_g2_i1.p1 TRINITY_DN33535_c0_g2~~TRINITY_DN33535_c0_g2_i1.p1  ORF type:complete len:719 (-),score=108.99 TRINITY_DN33535_c0_g2_i1:76-2142(-)